MGEVFRARDNRLNREVAIKVVPAALAQDTERVGRFRREAQILATLNHPNIAAIYGLEETAAAGPGQSAVVGLVMELVAGEDLAERLRRGAIPVEEAIGIARQIAEALEEAHEHGIVHRDLKPANVRLTPDGKVKVLDFGLAKALEGDPSSSATNPQISHSPTMSRHATEAGIILGTAAYMSPEQARGRTVDKRADIWAFGVVLYEMLTGQRLFAGETVSDTLAAVLRADPDWKALPDDTPAAINRLLHRCLTRDPKARLHDIADARLEIADALGNSGNEAKATAAPAAAAVIPRWRRALPWVAGAIMGAGLLAMMMGLGFGRALFAQSASELTPVTSTLLLPQGVTVAIHPSPARSGFLAVSRDGRQVAFVGRTAGVGWQIFVRAVDSQIARPVAGTEGGIFPAWSPDGRRIAFQQSGKLKQVSSDGGVAQVITDAVGTRSAAAWGPDDTLLFHPEYRGPLLRVSSGGGPVSEVLPALGEDQSWFAPLWLPDGRRFLVVRFAYSDDHAKDAGIYAGSIGSKDLTLIVPDRIAEVVLSNDEIFYRTGAELTAQSFDPRSLKLSGNPRTISSHASLVAAGGPTLVYFDPPGGLSLGYRIAWLSRSAAQLSTTGPAGSYRDPRISPDGRSLAIARADGHGLFSIWKYDIARNIDSRVSGTTFSTPVWSRDGRSIMAESAGGVRRFDALAFGPPQVIRTLKNRVGLLDVSPDGREVLVRSSPKAQLAAMPLDGSADPRLISDQVFEGSMHGGFSPDGKWIAVDAPEGGSTRLEVRPYPGPGARIPVTAMRASYARWRGDGRELYFISQVDGSQAIMAAAVTWNGGVPDFGPAQMLFKVPRLVPSNFGFDVTPDGQRFVAVVADDEDPSPLTMIVRAAVR